MKKNDIDRINKRLLFSIPPQKSDVAILLGNTMCSGEIAKHAARLYHHGYFNKIIVCGGVRLKTKTSAHRKLNNIFQRSAKHAGIKLSIPLKEIFSQQKEANYMIQVLLRSGVPQKNILHRDTKSQNTGQNFEFIQDTIYSNRISSATIVSAIFHQRRALETCKKWLPELHAITSPAYPYGISPNDWKKNWSKIEFARIAMFGEDFRLNKDRNPRENYYTQGFCVPVDVDSLLPCNNPQMRHRL